MTGYQDYNFPAFHAAAQAWRDGGWDAINPAEIEANDAEDSYRFYLRQDINLLVDCDAIAMLEGYENSKGAMLEMNIAQALKLRVYDAFHPVEYATHTFIDKNVCCNLVDYMHEDGWWNKV